MTEKRIAWADIPLRLGDWASLRTGAAAVRQAVFVVEQQIPQALEWDEWDALSVHAVAYNVQGDVIATGRLLPDGHIGRLAVCLPLRGVGIGGKILEALIEEARQRGHEAVVLHAQRYAEAFYHKHGFVTEGEPFQEAGIPHVRMRRQLCIKPEKSAGQSRGADV